ncbi:nitroreductase [Burkholderia pseudomultivorans]|uniref:Nitroreductase NfnB n=1 Tax=Burkholderia pseudomultivorans TaxID=1207504 RepID=A0ABU2E4A5_9BURK|nr:nitroreductase [Burkholderia pseudomultivorans]MDR8725975.1 Nitroreductase NfnB [Burkholderia pseudomultivorans]MDR8735128.1 Nitroreductase NfnB [Burkholderia pseudomultivorans]MDR8741051.1 Nitroreductase NfnB [Burkholderia pseudomultivorans]MDR8754398.1 Nitroreductase NfnB [Burkholderia pseudomultivorans]MDR8777508.1 Nitroreductase NfnB [Burkholderia pseudomultivorans]
MQAQCEGKDAGGRSAADVETLERIAAERFTCRAYLPDAVPTDVIERIVEVAKRAASWCNVQPWHAIVASRDTTERFRAALVAHAAQHPGIDADMPFPDEYRGVYGERRREVGYALYAALGIARDDRPARERQVAENFRLFGAPHVALLTIPAELGPYAALDCGAFVASFLLAARAHGVATTAQAALAHHARFIRRYFGIDDARRFVCGIAFGYADMTHPANAFRSTRAATADVMQMV